MSQRHESPMRALASLGEALTRLHPRGGKPKTKMIVPTGHSAKWQEHGSRGALPGKAHWNTLTPSQQDAHAAGWRAAKRGVHPYTLREAIENFRQISPTVHGGPPTATGRPLHRMPKHAAFKVRTTRADNARHGNTPKAVAHRDAVVRDF